MGADSSTTQSDASLLVKNNFEYTKHLASWCAAKNVRFIYASSAATYGDGSRGYVDDEKLLGGLRPLNMYGYSKHMFDMWAARKGLLDKFAGLKYFNVYGPNEYHKGDMRSMAVKAYEQIRSTGKVRLFKSCKKEYRDGEQLRDFIYVKDAAAMTLHFLNPEIPGGLYNIGTGKAQSWLKMMKALFAALKLEPEIEFIPMPDALKNKYQYYTQADLTKLRAAGYTKPLMTLEEGITDYVGYLESGLQTLGA
jgi:ADP-L-glycero-D-manno-heptose 6-epimerase